MIQDNNLLRGIIVQLKSRDYSFKDKTDSVFKGLKVMQSILSFILAREEIYSLP